jgi:hypothetical protein
MIQPITSDSPYYLKPPTDVIVINGKKTPFYGLETVSLPATYTYLIQEIKVINTSTTSIPSFSAFTNVTGFGYTVPPPVPLIITTLLTSEYSLRCMRFNLNGILYFGNEGIIQSFSNNTITTVAGNWTLGFTNDGGLASESLIGAIRGIDFDSNGNIFFADLSNHVIRKIDINSGILSTIAGTGGVKGNSTYNGSATSSLINEPRDLLIDSNGNIYFPSYSGHVINKIDTNGIITKIAGTGTAGFSGDGGLAINASINNPSQITFFKNELYVIDASNFRVRKINLDSGIISTVVGNGVNGSSEEGVQATSTSLFFPRGIAFDNIGNMYVTTDTKVNKVNLTGIITTVAGNGNKGNSGDGGSPLNATFYQTYYLEMDSNDNLFVADYYNINIRKINFGEQ